MYVFVSGMNLAKAIPNELEFFYSRFTLGGDIAMKGMLTKGLSLLALNGVLFAGVPSADALSINVYHNKANWKNAVDHTFKKENFNERG